MAWPVPTVATPPEWEAVFRLLFQSLLEEEREIRVRNALQLLERREFDPSGVLVVHGKNGLAGVLVCLAVPGASGLIWPPQIATGLSDRAEIEDLLIASAKECLRRQGVRVAQSMLLPEEQALAEPLVRNGFQQITTLWYMKHALHPVSSWWNARADLQFEDYRICDHELFQQTLARTYEGTRDCPEVNGVRTMEEVLQGHRAQGVFDPSRWWLALRDGQAVGVLLLCDMPDVGSWDLAYLGIVPEARKQGIGRALTRLALREACQAVAPSLTLAVDKRNAPAWDLYRSEGFEPFDLRDVYLAVWDSAGRIFAGLPVNGQ